MKIALPNKKCLLGGIAESILPTHSTCVLRTHIDTHPINVRTILFPEWSNEVN